MVLSSDVFQSTHPSGVRQHTGLPDSMRVLFQSTHPSGVRPVQFTPLGTVTDFNPRTPVGCDPCSASGARRSRYFNPRTPVGCDSMLSIARNIDVQFQSTHPSGVRHAHHGHAHRPRRISIHAPQWGATRGRMRHVRHRAISIHAPQWGATIGGLVGSWSSHRFQSTHPSGVRRGQPAPPWAGYRNFNPRTPVGCDMRRRRTWNRSANFNPRTPVGCDSTPCMSACAVADFNPRTPVGCDRPLDSRARRCI